MADLNVLGYFKLTGAARIVAADSTDIGVFPDAYAVNCDVTIQPRLVGPTIGGQALTVTATDPKLLVLLAPIAARLDAGMLRLRRPDGDSSESTDPLGPGGVWLLAQTPALNLPEGARLVFDITFGRIILGASTFRLDPFTFAAPTNTGVALDLSTVERINTPTTGSGLVLRMIPDRTRIENGRLVFSAQGIDIPDPISLSELNLTVDVIDGGTPGSSGDYIIDGGTP